MPITITVPSGPPLEIGVGMGIHLSSDFVGAFPADSTWSTQIFPPSAETALIASLSFTPAQHELDTVLVPEQGWVLYQATGQPAQGAQVAISTTLAEANGTVIDQSTTQMPWNSSRGLSSQIALKPIGTGSGLTELQAQQLTETHASTWPQSLLDKMLLTPMQSGPTGGPVAAFLLTPTAAVIVRLSQIPPELAAQTPDRDYWLPTLAVVRVFRGSDLWLRVPIHTSSKIVDFMSEGLLLGLADAWLTEWLLDLSVQVTFLPGVLGEAFLMTPP